MTALMFAVKVGSLDVVKLLVEKSADLFAQNSVSFTPSIDHVYPGYHGVFPY
jgi:ankyrin repeat protein